MVKKALLALAVLSITGFFSSGFLLAPPDSVLIKQAIEDSTAAARNGEPSEVLDNLSRRFNYGGEVANRSDIIKVVRQSKPHIVVEDIKPLVEGETATVISPVTVKGDFMGFTIDTTFPRVTIGLKKELGTQWGVVPTPRWRIVSVDADQLPSY